MLEITLPSSELFYESTNEFIKCKEKTLQLEHSLVSLSKWESKWCKPFLTKNEKTYDETLDYIKCMTITQNVDPETYLRLSDKNITEIKKYIAAPMTATVIRQVNTHSGPREIVTAELIYYWMISLNIPFECQKWHLNRLLALIKVCNIKNQPPKKIGTQELMSRYASLNAIRRKQLGTKG